ncbi:MAG TPA: universal stress protein [Flavobacteriaceae bacterium]|nr:universal stress protein [Flavobacteriaceae bacterium]MCB9213867.1 universal stress protein [Alteromonas sp.]HPF11263.1 universal stress protein [Flavobacteriaceae bacterium]HQU21742.1 universal stress protein [Flavobacteriaceae bacterium]HQU64518.1 universal stress protein [Flavobacteriaceae bacterium]
MKKKILIPTDFSRNAYDAIAYAVDLFEKVPCEFYILNVYSLTDYATDNIMVPQLDGNLFDKLKENSEKGLEKILTQLSFRDESDRHSFATLSQQNNLIDALKDIVELKDIDLIVMGTKGAADALNVVFGSNTVLVMEKIRNCPVLAIPPNTIFQPINEIVFPTGFKTHFKMQEMHALVAIAQLVEAPIRIVHLVRESALDEEQQNYKELLESCFEGLEYSFHSLDNKNLNEAVEVFAQSRDSGMIAFVNKKHTFFTNLFRTPMVKELGMHAKVPVLALHDHGS